MEKKLLDQISLFFADLPHTRPFPGLWCKKIFHFDFSQKNEKNLKLVFNPSQPHMWVSRIEKGVRCAFVFWKKNQKIDLSTPIDRKHSLPDDWCAQN